VPEEGNIKDSPKKKNLLFRTIEYTRDNKCFFMVVKAFFYSASFRLQLLMFKPKKMKKHWGVEKEESSVEEPEEYADYVGKVSRAVLCVCNNTKWESKCLVRALTAQKLLKKRKLHSTLYLGVRQDEEGKMLAHAWLRWGKFIVTGGNEDLSKYAVVSKFRH
jgi:hypothetical protein